MSEMQNGWAAKQLGKLFSLISPDGTPCESNADHFQGASPLITFKGKHVRFVTKTKAWIARDMRAVGKK